MWSFRLFRDLDFLASQPKHGWNLPRIASAWSQLMQRLGYRRWVAQGGDWGAGVTTALGHLLSPWARWNPSQLAIRVSDGNPRAPQFRRAESGRWCQTLPGRRQRLLPPNKRLGRRRSDIHCRIHQRARLCGSTKNFTVGTDNNGSPEDALSRDQDARQHFHSTGSQTPRHRQHGSTGRIRTPHFPEASLACLSPQTVFSARDIIVLQRAGPSRPTPISSTGMRLSTGAISPLSSSRTSLSGNCVPPFEN